MSLEKLFPYHTVIEKQIPESKVEHGDEVEIIPAHVKQEVVLKGGFNLDNVVCYSFVENGSIDVYLNLVYEQAVPFPKYKNAGKGRRQLTGYEEKFFSMPMGITLTLSEDIARFKELIGSVDVPVLPELPKPTTNEQTQVQAAV